MNEDNQDLSQDEVVETPDAEVEVEGITEEEEHHEEEPQVEASSEEDSESGQPDLDGDEPEWMVKRLKRQRRKLGEEHARKTAQLQSEVEQMRSILSSQTKSNQPYNYQQPVVEEKAQFQLPPNVDRNDPIAVANAVMDQRERMQYEAQVKEQQQQQQTYAYNHLLGLAEELQVLQDSSKSDFDPCEGRLNESMMDNALRFENSGKLLRSVCSGKDWKRIYSLPPIEQGREMARYSRTLEANASRRTKSSAPKPVEHQNSSGGSALAKDTNSLQSHEIRAAIREGRL